MRLLFNSNQPACPITDFKLYEDELLTTIIYIGDSNINLKVNPVNNNPILTINTITVMNRILYLKGSSYSGNFESIKL